MAEQLRPWKVYICRSLPLERVFTKYELMHLLHRNLKCVYYIECNLITCLSKPQTQTKIPHDVLGSRSVINIKKISVNVL